MLVCLDKEVGQAVLMLFVALEDFLPGKSSLKSPLQHRKWVLFHMYVAAVAGHSSVVVLVLGTRTRVLLEYHFQGTRTRTCTRMSKYSYSTYDSCTRTAKYSVLAVSKLYSIIKVLVLDYQYSIKKIRKTLTYHGHLNTTIQKYRLQRIGSQYGWA